MWSGTDSVSSSTSSCFLRERALEATFSYSVLERLRKEWWPCAEWLIILRLCVLTSAVNAWKGGQCVHQARSSVALLWSATHQGSCHMYDQVVGSAAERNNLNHGTMAKIPPATSHKLFLLQGRASSSRQWWKAVASLGGSVDTEDTVVPKIRKRRAREPSF